MILSGLEIKKRLGEDIIIYPFDDKRLNPNSYNLRLDRKLLVYDQVTLDMKRDNHSKELFISDDGLMIYPGRLYLAKTVEYTETHNGLVPMLEGRSSIGRLGISIHVTAGFGDVGFKGCWTLEMTCVHPVRIYPYVEICQIYYHELLGDYIPYSSGKYQDAQDVQTSKLYLEVK